SGAVGLVVVATISMGFVVTLGMMASARARARRARRRVPGLRLPLLQRPLLVAFVAAVIAAPLLTIVVPYRSVHPKHTRTPPRTQTVRRPKPPPPLTSERLSWPSLAAAAAGGAPPPVPIAPIAAGGSGATVPPRAGPPRGE